MPGGDSRAVAVAERILAMSDTEVKATLDGVRERFAHRHRRLEATWTDNFHLAARRLGHGAEVAADRALLIGAYFTSEVSLEAAALFNPSIVAHPDQSGLGSGETRFVMSLRAVSEGHVSSIEFRTGVVGAAGDVVVDDPGPFVELGRLSPGPFTRHLFHTKLAEHRCDNQAAALVLDGLADQFGPEDLGSNIAALHPDVLSRGSVKKVVELVRWVAANNYTVEFSAATSLAERVLWPSGPSEAQGMEDARFVRFVDDGGSVTYLATYTAFDHTLIVPQLLMTTDFRTFTVSQLSGPFAANKGLALFPRKLGGRYVALSRWDREGLSVATSDDGYEWADATTLHWERHPWDLVQVGNCGSPLETPDGWLLLTHGVGPMREYAIGAVLLDLDDPRRVVASLPSPLLVADGDEREGYVPNVVYSCGALVNGQDLVLPYGFSDSAVGFALVDLNELLGRLRAPVARATITRR